MDKAATIVIQFPSTKQIYIGVKYEWWVEYFGLYLGYFHGFFIAKVNQNYLEVTLLASDFHTEILGLLSPDQHHTLDDGKSSSSADPKALQVVPYYQSRSPW